MKLAGFFLSLFEADNCVVSGLKSVATTAVGK